MAAHAMQSFHNEEPVNYNFRYEVQDEHTGDIKSQHETRNGDVVSGSYELIDSDGFKRIVDYTADDIHGFNAVVRREPTSIKIPVPVTNHQSNKHKQQVHKSSYQPSYQSTNHDQLSYQQPDYDFLPIPSPSYLLNHHFKHDGHLHNSLDNYKPRLPKDNHLELPSGHSSSHDSTHVTFNSPDANYHY